MDITRTAGFFAATALLTSCVVSADAAVLYHVDKLGPSVNHDDIIVGTAASNVDQWWANQFNVQPGGEQITQIGLTNGNNLTVGGPVSLLVYDDPNNDGDPSDAVLLRETIVNIVESDGSYHEPTFFAIPPTTVTGSFFIAALLKDVPGNAGMTFHNEPGTSLGRSWLAVNSTSPGTFDPADVLGSSPDLPPATIDSLGVPGNWVLRAVGEAVPEPSGGAIVALGLLALGTLRSRGF